MTAKTCSDSDVLRALCASSTSEIAIFDAPGRCHQVVATHAPFGTQTTVGTTLHDLFAASVAEQHIAMICAALHSGQRQTLRFSTEAAAQVRWYQTTISPLDATLVLWVAHDITEQYALEQAQVRLRLFESLAEQSLDGIALAGADTILTYTNTAYQAMAGYGDQSIGMSFLDLFSADVRAGIIEDALPTMMQDGTWQGTLAAQRPDRSAWTMQISTSVLPTAPDQPPMLAAIMRDVTAQQQAEQRLKLFETLVEKAGDGIAVADLATTNCTYLNPAYRTMMGYGEEMVGHSFVAHFGEDPAYIASLVALTSQQDMWRGTLTYKRANGTTFPGELTAYLLPGTIRQDAVVVGIVRDLSEQQRQAAENAALQEQVIAAQQAALRELSTPLVPIARGVVAMPLVGTVDSARAQQIMETLLEGITAQQVRYAILDITGVKIVDTQVASALVRVAQAARLLGAQVILTGIRPEVAQTLVQLGADLAGMTTRATVETGIAYALAGEAAQVARR